MNKLAAYILVLLNLMAVHRPQAQDHGLLHLNKHYFTTGEDVYFAFYLDNKEHTDKISGKADDKSTLSNANNVLTEPLYAALLEMKGDHQVLEKLVKLRWNKNRTGGYMPVPGELNSGQYILGLFSSHGLRVKKFLAHRTIYIFNPEQDFNPELDLPQGTKPDNDLSENIDSGSRQQGDEFPAVSGENTTIHFSLEKSTADREDLLVFNGQVISGNNLPVMSYLSVSVIDKRFYGDTDLYDLLPIEPWSPANEKLPDQAGDQDEVRDSRYIHGQLMIDGKPASIKKLYFYAHKNNEIILDKYITSRNGEFWFLEAPFSDRYTIQLLTFPEKDRNYSFRLLSDQIADRIFHLDPDPCQVECREAYRNHALKKFLIDRSYPEAIKDTAKVTPSPGPAIKAAPSHVIIPDEFFDFSTLPEIIREIVPQVSIKYKKEHYEMRIYDSRARNYCCEENPLIFVNREPFMDIDPVMEINPDHIYSIEVIRPIEAIRAFGDIGVNGILKINLYPDIKEPDWPSEGKVTYQIPGYQGKKEYLVPEFAENYPDFRSFLFWDGDIITNNHGRFQFQFKPSKLAGDFLIIIRGITSRGQFISKDIEYNPENIHP